jgi:hypothetical protein
MIIRRQNIRYAANAQQPELTGRAGTRKHLLMIVNHQGSCIWPCYPCIEVS